MSTYLLIGGIALVSGLLVRDFAMQATIAKCRTNQEQAQRFESLADRLAQELEIDRDVAIAQIESASDDCLDRSVDELLLNP